jgi:ribose 5-phosphate isomerase
MKIFERALELLPNCSRIGLGSGRAARWFVRAFNCGMALNPRSYAYLDGG